MVTNVKVEFGRRIRNLRNKKGISQEELASRCGLHRTYIGDIERGKRNPSLINIIRLANALEVSAGTLLGEIGKNWE